MWLSFKYCDCTMPLTIPLCQVSVISYELTQPISEMSTTKLGDNFFKKSFINS